MPAGRASKQAKRASEEAAALGGSRIKLGEPWIQLRGLQSQVGGPWIQLGGPPSKLGGPLIKLDEPWSWLGGVGEPQSQQARPAGRIQSKLEEPLRKLQR